MTQLWNRLLQHAVWTCAVWHMAGKCPTCGTAARSFEGARGSTEQCGTHSPTPCVFPMIEEDIYKLFHVT